MIYLDVTDLLHVAERALGAEPLLRDVGLLEAAAARPRATAFGDEAYPTLEAKAAALVHSISRNHALVDGNKRLALAGLIAFLGINGRRLTMTNDEAYDFIIAVSTGQLDDVLMIAERINTATADRGLSAVGRAYRHGVDKEYVAETVAWDVSAADGLDDD